MRVFISVVLNGMAFHPPQSTKKVKMPESHAIIMEQVCNLSVLVRHETTDNIS